jgi:hypothetical protein
MITRAYRLLQENPIRARPKSAMASRAISAGAPAIQTIVRAIRAAADRLNSAKEAAE